MRESVYNECSFLHIKETLSTIIVHWEVRTSSQESFKEHVNTHFHNNFGVQ